MEFLYFGSGVKLRELSNLYECEIEYNGYKYISSEHLYQSLQFNEFERFTINGDLSGYDCLVKYKDVFYSKKSVIESKVNYWKVRKCIGIVAKMCSNKKYMKKLGLTYTNKYIKDDIFEEILRLKFNQKYFKTILLNTGDKTLVEFSRFDLKWGGKVIDNKIVGENLMGNMIEKIRNEIKSQEIDRC